MPGDVPLASLLPLLQQGGLGRLAQLFAPPQTQLPPEFGDPSAALARTYQAGQNYRAGMNAAGDAVIGAATAGPMAVGRIVTGQGSADDLTDAMFSLAPGLKGAAMAAPVLGMAAKAAEREAGPAAEAVARGITAYHGSPHDFERFDLGKIGTGEGAQAYGHGLYFAENEATAKSYRDMLAGKSSNDIDGLALGAFRHADNDSAAAARSLRERAAQEERDPFSGIDPNRMRAAADKLDAGWRPAGKMYQVNINADPEHFLDWDKPLSEQHPKVQEALRAAGALNAPTYSWQETRSGVNHLLRSDAGSQSWGNVAPAEFGGFWAHDAHGAVVGHAATEDAARNMVVEKAPRMSAPDAKKLSGQLAYYGAANTAGDDLAASNALRQAGIPGIKYLDQGSRTAGDGTRNYVVFDDKMIDILKKYGMAGLIAGGAAHFALPGDQAQAAQGPVPLSSMPGIKQ